MSIVVHDFSLMPGRIRHRWRGGGACAAAAYRSESKLVCGVIKPSGWREIALVYRHYGIGEENIESLRGNHLNVVLKIETLWPHRQKYAGNMASAQ